jgi:hypothetical protein
VTKSVASIVAAWRVQELPQGRVGVPLRRRRDLQRLQDAVDRGCADSMAELEQLTLNPAVMQSSA